MSNWKDIDIQHQNESMAVLYKHAIRVAGCNDEIGSIKIRSYIPNQRVINISCSSCKRSVIAKCYDHDSAHFLNEIKYLELLKQYLPKKSIVKIPNVFSVLNSECCAIIEEYIPFPTLHQILLKTIESGNNRPLLSALSLISDAFVSIHGIQAPNMETDFISLHDTQEIIQKYSTKHIDLLCLYECWLKDEFLETFLSPHFVLDNLTPTNILYSHSEKRLGILDFEHAHIDTPLVDIGCFCAELKLFFVQNSDNSFLAEPYIGYFLREYFTKQKYLKVTFRQFTWLQTFFMARRLLLISEGKWLDPSIAEWAVTSAVEILNARKHKASILVPAFRKKKAIIFDFYNTLVEIKDDEGKLQNFEIVASFLQKALPSGLPLNFPDAITLRDQYFNEIRLSYERSHEIYPDIDLETIWGAILAETGISIALLYKDGKILLRDLLLLFRKSATSRFYSSPESINILKLLKSSGLKIGIISDAQLEYAISEMNTAGVLSIIDCLILSGEFRFQKPDRRLFECALQRMKINHSDAVFVGDDMHRDIFGAKQLGIQTIYKSSPFGEKIYDTYTPDDVIRTLSDLPNALGISI